MPNFDMKKQPDDAAIEIPEIPASARLKKSRHHLPANSMMPERKVTLALEADLINFRLALLRLFL